MPGKILNVLADHGNGALSAEGTYEESYAIINRLVGFGISPEDVTNRLEANGVAAFIKPRDLMLAGAQSGTDHVSA